MRWPRALRSWVSEHVHVCVFMGVHVCMHMGLDPCVCMLQREHVCMCVRACEHVFRFYLHCWLAAWRLG